MTGPESVYGAMTSGNPAVVSGVETGLEDAMRDVRSQLELIRYAADKPDWSSPSARTRFNMTAWTTRATAEVSFIRLNRAKLSLAQAVDAYRRMDTAATAVIEHWRRWKSQVADPISLLLLRAAVLTELAAIRADYTLLLEEARDFVEADPLTDEQRDWLVNGLARSMRRDLENGSNPGPIIPGTLATGDDDGGWTPQGLGYDPHSGYLLQTSYHGTQAQLSLVDPGTGELVQTVQLAAVDDESLPPDHAGGVAVHDGVVWVTSSGSPGQVFSYSLSQITSAAPGAAVPPRDTPQEIAEGAYSTIVGDTMYVGSFEHGPGKLYTYTWDPSSGSWADKQGPFPTPPETQGVAVRGGEIVFSSSWGRDNGSTLQSYNLGDVLAGGSLGSPLQTVALPNMSEGIAMLPHGVLATYESGAAGYVDPDGNPLETLWASMNMTVTPYADLGLADDGIDVETPTLREASRIFDEVRDGLDDVRRRISGLSLPSGALGDVPEAASFASAMDRHCTATADWLGKGTLASGVTASGLIATATDYDETDDSSGGLFDVLRGLLP
jgi:hypothetical protein